MYEYEQELLHYIWRY